MNIAGLLFLLITHFLTGRGILQIFGVKNKLWVLVPLSFIIGVVLFSWIPTVLEMCHIPITKSSVSIAILILTAVTFGVRAHKMNYKIFTQKPRFGLRVYEIVYICVFIWLMAPSVWRCYYFPPNARDVLSGPEPIAEYAVKEHTMVNSALTVDLTGTNNHLKPPFISGLQIVYKLLVHPFGQLWLSVIVISFLVMLYYLLRSQVHPLIAGFLMLFFICMPDPYGYTYVILFDYSNMVLFFAAVYYLSVFAATREKNLLWFASFLFALGTMIRSETVVLAGMFSPLIVYLLYRDGMKIYKAALMVAIFLFIPFMAYYVWIDVFLKYYMPGTFDLGGQMTKNWGDIDVFFTRFMDMNKGLLFGKSTAGMYGYIHFVFLFVLLLDCVFIRRFSKEARIMLYGIAVVYIGLPLLGYMLPLFDLNNTTKRGLYKLFPLMMLYMANSGVLVRISEAIRSFELPKPEAVKPQPVKQQVKSSKPAAKRK